MATRRAILTAGYRADGLRAWKTTSAGTTYYLYDGDNPVEELNGTGTKTAVMTFGPNGVLARTTASRTLLYTLDALGQMAQQIDASTGNIIANYPARQRGPHRSDPRRQADRPDQGVSRSARPVPRRRDHPHLRPELRAEPQLARSVQADGDLADRAVTAPI